MELHGFRFDDQFDECLLAEANGHHDHHSHDFEL
jgi:hypothetical protein